MVVFITLLTDAITGLVYYNFRYYSPALGRWTKRDPINERGGINLYGMISNNPVLQRDRLGLEYASAAVAIDSGARPPGGDLGGDGATGSMGNTGGNSSSNSGSNSGATPSTPGRTTSSAVYLGDTDTCGKKCCGDLVLPLDFDSSKQCCKNGSISISLNYALRVIIVMRGFLQKIFFQENIIHMDVGKLVFALLVKLMNLE